jgi:hypothetical protein
MQANFWLRSLQEHGYKIEIFYRGSKELFSKLWIESHYES